MYNLKSITMKKVFLVFGLLGIFVSCEKDTVEEDVAALKISTLEKQIVGSWILEGQLIDGKLISMEELDIQEGIPLANCPYDFSLTFGSDFKVTETSYSGVQINGGPVECSLDTSQGIYEFTAERALDITWSYGDKISAGVEIVDDILILTDIGPDQSGSFQLRRKK